MHRTYGMMPRNNSLVVARKQPPWTVLPQNLWTITFRLSFRKTHRKWRTRWCCAWREMILKFKWRSFMQLVLKRLQLLHRLNGRAPQYLAVYRVPLSNKRHLRSAERNLLHVPRHRQRTHGSRLLLLLVRLPGTVSLDPVRNPNSTEAALRSLLKTFLFTHYYTLVPGVQQSYTLNCTPVCNSHSHT